MGKDGNRWGRKSFGFAIIPKAPSFQCYPFQYGKLPFPELIRILIPYSPRLLDDFYRL
jgi:hypothetical protein